MTRVAFIVGLILSAAPAWAAPPTEGNWSVQVSCAGAGQGTKQYIIRFPAVVINGILHGEFGTPGQAGSSVLEGRLASNGAATLQMHGLTGTDTYATGRVASATPFSYNVEAHFDATRGDGKRTTPGRDCTLVFFRPPS